MSRIETLSIPVGSNTKYLDRGYAIQVIKQKKKVVVPCETAYHEAEHVVAAEKNGTSVEMATIIPASDYLGLTVLSKPDAVSAAAPYSNGRGGTGFDTQVVQALGKDLGVASTVAKVILSGNKDKVQAVAEALEENNIIGPSEIKKAMEGKKEENITIFIKSPKGKESKFTNLEADKGKIMLPGIVVELVR